MNAVTTAAFRIHLMLGTDKDTLPVMLGFSHGIKKVTPAGYVL